MKKRIIFLLIAGAGCPAQTWAQVFDNNSVVALHQAGLGDNTLIAKVNASPCGYDVSTDGLISLKRAGISDAVIATMVERCGASRTRGSAANSADPSTRHAPGIYFLQDWANPPQMQVIRPSKASGIRVTGNGSLLFPYVGKLVLPDGKSRNDLKDHRPLFYFYFLAGDRKVSDFGSPDSIAAQSPDEFMLIHFKVKNNQREIGVGRVSAFNIRRGLDMKEAISFSSEEIGDGTFKVSVKEDLAQGEYAFVLTGASGAARVYDFTIG